MSEMASGTRMGGEAVPCDDSATGLPPQAEQLSACVQQALTIIAKRWTPLILYVLQRSPLRFNELAAGIPFVSDKMLSERLKELEAEGLVERRVFAEVPVRVEYRLTEKGHELETVFHALATWAGKWLGSGVPPCDEARDAAAATPQNPAKNTPR